MNEKTLHRGSGEEDKLINQYRNNPNQEILGQIFQPYIQKVYGLCLKYFKNTHDAEDATMDIYLSLGKKLQRHEVNNFKSWLYVVARNHCLDVLRSRGRKFSKENEAELMYSEEIFHPDNEENEEEVKKLENCVQQLPEEQKKCIDLFYFQKISYKEITALTSYTWSQVRSYIQNGRRNLKNCIERS